MPAARQKRVPKSAEGVQVIEIIERLKEALEVGTDHELATALGVSRNTIATWKKRNTIPYEECLRVALGQMASLDWLITGRGNSQNLPDIHDGTIDTELLAIILKSQAGDLKKIDVSTWEKIRFQARLVAREYLADLRLMRDAVQKQKLNRAEFLEMLRKAKDKPIWEPES